MAIVKPAVEGRLDFLAGWESSMNESDEKALRRDFANAFPGLHEAGKFGEVQREIRRLEKGRVDIPAGDPSIVGSTFNGSSQIRMFAAACRSVFYGKPPDGLDEQTELMNAILDPKVDDPRAHVQKRIGAQQQSIRTAREGIKARPEHQRIINEDVGLEKILEGHESE